MRYARPLGTALTVLALLVGAVGFFVAPVEARLAFAIAMMVIVLAGVLLLILAPGNKR